MTIQDTLIELRKQRLPRLDPAWTTTAAIFLVVLLLAPPQAADSAWFTARAIVNVLPFFALSIGLAAYAKASGAENLIAGAFTGSPAVMIVLASLMGALSPFCSCGVIPVIAALLATGVPLAPVMAFWLASPLMDPSMFFLTAGVLGFPFAIAKTFAAIGVGLLGGFAVVWLQAIGFLTGPVLRDGAGNGGCAGAKIRKPKPVMWRAWTDPARRGQFWGSAAQNTMFLGKWLVLAYVLESLMVVYIPGDLVARIAGDGSLLSIVAATLVGIPSYLNGNAALPLVGGLMDKGMAPGAAMAFLIGGGVTSIPAALAVFGIAQRNVFVTYLAVATIGALLAGMIFQAVV